MVCPSFKPISISNILLLTKIYLKAQHWCIDWMHDVTHNPISLRFCVGVKQARAAAKENVNIGPSKLKFGKQFS